MVLLAKIFHASAWQMLPVALFILVLGIFLWESRMHASRRIMGRLSGEAGRKQTSHRRASLS